ncbi:serine hydrolase domain-containing protein [uncultured Dokdonia sp.]|uniref:serine hydrolase domain-containing protein n=1 Tax=uncultured Dokdonia sp. TaxID=575653 RepID=UPI00262C734B|nr:serine hydrolase domain-containing protein [uncultured Dokdonia sp.]
MKTRITMILMVCISFMMHAQNTSEKELLKTFDAHTPTALEKNNVPGLAVAIIKNGEVILKKGYGYSDVSHKELVTPTTGFNIGSISKMFTAWGIMKLVEDGKLALDTPAANYITSWKLPDSEFDSKKVTIRNLLQHTAGLSVHGYPGYENKGELTSTIQCLSGNGDEEALVQLIMEPGSSWKYSGGGYSVLQLVIEEVSGTSFANYMETTIFKPLKMKHSSFTIDHRILKTSAKGYDKDGNEIPLRLFNAQAAAGLHTTIEDLILFAKASLSKNPVLSQESIALLITPTELSRGNYGMGYMVMNRFGDFTLSGHGGSNKGWQSGFMLDFESKSGIIVLTNGSSGKKVLFGSMKDWAQWRATH